MYRIAFYRTARGESPVEEFLNALPEKHQRKIAGFLELLEEHGPALMRPYADHVRGPLRELRVPFGRHAYRVFHFIAAGDRVVLLHAFAKKTPDLPAREIATAEGRMKDWLERLARGEIA